MHVRTVILRKHHMALRPSATRAVVRTEFPVTCFMIAQDSGLIEPCFPTHVAMKPRHGWGTQFVVEPMSQDLGHSPINYLHLPHQHRLGEHLLDAAQRLPRPLFVLNQREAHVAVAVFAEADARRHSDLGLGQQQL